MSTFLKGLDKRVRSARPPLSLVAPLTHKIILGSILFNVWIGYSIYQQPVLPLVIVGSIFNKIFWALSFVVVSGILVAGLKLNDWKMIRLGMSLGVLVKSIWAYALFFVGLKYGFTSIMGVLALWVFALWVQFITTIYFVPTGPPRA